MAANPRYLDAAKFAHLIRELAASTAEELPEPVHAEGGLDRHKGCGV